MRKSLLIFILICSCTIGQAQGIAKKAGREITETVMKVTGKKAVKTTERIAAHASAEEISTSLGTDYAKTAVFRQCVNRTIRDRMKTVMKKEGCKSFLQFGVKKAAEKLKAVSLPKFKNVIVEKSNKNYHAFLQRMRNGEYSALSKEGRGMARNVIRKTNLAIANVTEKTLKELDAKDILDILKKNPAMAKRLKEFPEDFQLEIAKAMKNDYSFFNEFTSYEGWHLIKFEELYKGMPAVKNNPTIFKMFVQDQFITQEFGSKRVWLEILLKEEKDGSVSFFKKGTNELIGTFKEGEFLVKNPKILELLYKGSPLSGRLLPNITYKIPAKSKGLFWTTKYMYVKTDAHGRIMEINAEGVTMEEVKHLLALRKDVKLGHEWERSLRTIQSKAKGKANVDINYRLSYRGSDPRPANVDMDIKVDGEQEIKRSYKNIRNLHGQHFTATQNRQVVDQYERAVNGLTPKQKSKLLKDMECNEELANLIHSDPKSNIQRYVNANRDVDKSKIVRSKTGSTRNASYAGRTFYFNKELNPHSAELYTEEELDMLDRMFPEGVPFSEKGYPDFRYTARKEPNGKPVQVHLDKWDEHSSQVDIENANKEYSRTHGGQRIPEGSTWHHEPDGHTLTLVPTRIHDKIKHNGGRDAYESKNL